MTKAIIFDMDGLMIDSERVTYEIYEEILNEQGQVAMGEDFYCSMIGSNHKDNLIRLKNKFTNVDCEEMVAEVYRRIAKKFDLEGPTVKPGLFKLLEYLKANQYKTMVATSSSRHRVDDILAKAKLTEYFDDVICGDEIKNGKPAPDIFLEAIKKLQVNSDEAYVLEDSPAGIQASVSAAIKVIAIPDMVKIEGQPLEQAHTVLPTLNEVITYLDNK